MTSSQPGSELELQLYRVLERANLLQYYDTFISQGGDDVRQLCEAGEEEFLEIMALVGMASKPLHVRRLQKALQEWVQSPVMFSQPLGTALPPTSAAPDSIIATMQQAAQYTCATPPPQKSQESSNQCWPEHNDHSPVGSSINGTMGGQDSLSEYPMIISETSSKCTSLQEQGGSQSGFDRDTDSPELSNKLPVMLPHQIEALARAAEELARGLPMYEPKQLNIKKPRNKDILDVMNLPTDHPNRMELLRKYGAIYGRYDSKRKNEKYMSLHEMSVNEAASQLCSRRPTLLTRREDLFILARQVVRDSGYQYSKGHSRGQAVDIPPNKKARLEELLQREITPRSAKAELEKSSREERMTEINSELTEITSQQTDLKKKISEASAGGGDSGAATQPLQDQLQNLTRRQLKLLTEQSDVIKRQQLVQKYQSKDVTFSDNGNSRDGPDSDDSDLPPSEPTSPRECASGDGGTSGKTSSVRKSLYDEGLRIAQQYGLEDLAQEIKVLQPVKLEGTGAQENVTSSTARVTQEGVVESTPSTTRVKQEGGVESKPSRADSLHYGDGSRGVQQFNVGDHSHGVRISQPSKHADSVGHGQSDFNLGTVRIKQEGATESKTDMGKACQYGEALRVSQQYGLGSTTQLDGVGGSRQPDLMRLPQERTLESNGKVPKTQSMHLKAGSELRNRHEIDHSLGGGTGRHGMDNSLGGARSRQDLEIDEQREWNREVEHDLKILLKRNGHASDNFKIERNEVSS